MTPDERLRRDLTVREDGCWLWTGHVERSGYGRFTFCMRTVWAHRFAYETWVGPIPEGMHIDHLCNVRACINPEHLEPVTQAENNRRARARQYAGTMYGCGHPQTRGGPCQVCAAARRAERDARRSLPSPPKRPSPAETGMRGCGHPYEGKGADCRPCARARAAEYRAAVKAGAVQPKRIICVECQRDEPNCANGLCRRCYTRLYKRAVTRQTA